MPLPPVNIVHVVINEHGRIFDDLIDLLTDCLVQLDVPVRRSTSHFDSTQLNLVVGHTAFLSPTDYPAIASKCRYIVFQVEALHEQAGLLPDRPHYLEFLRRAQQVWDYSPQNLKFLAGRGHQNTRYVPIGYCPMLERIAAAPTKDIDVLFYGAATPRRRRIFDDLLARGVRFVSVFGAYGPQRDQLIARSKIVLNLHQFDISALEQLRISYLLNNRCFVLSESPPSELYGEGVVFSDYGSITECCVSYLQPGMEPQRTRIAEVGYAGLKAIPTLQHLRSAIEQFA
jgi:hypothetical protein